MLKTDVLLQSRPVAADALEAEEKELMDEYNRDYKFRPAAYPADKAMRLQQLMRRRSRVVTPGQAPMLRGDAPRGDGFQEVCKLNNTGKTLLPKE